MQVFLSYHTPDREIATSLKNAIEGNQPGTDVFLDQTHLRHGHFWQDALYKAIDDTDAFLLLLSNKVGDWQKAEFREANDKKQKNPESFLLLPIIIADPNIGPAPNLHGLSQLHWIECNEPAAPEPLAKIAEALSGRVTPKPIEPWRRFNPYRGLLALEEEDTEFFYGRDEITADILNAMIDQPDKMITLIGNSGVGKSSLVQAGVIGALKRRRWPIDGQGWPENGLADPRNWAYLTMRPGKKPIRALVDAFTSLWKYDATDTIRFEQNDKWTERLKSTGRLSELLEATDGRFTELGEKPPKRIFLYIDQGEELYSSAISEEIKQFSSIVAEPLMDERFLLMSSQRADYYGHLQANEILFPKSYRVDVPPLSSKQIQQVLEEPARILGAKFESDRIVGSIVNNAANQPGALPLLADDMTELWTRMQKRKDGILKLTEKSEIFKIGGALTARADKFLNENRDKAAAVNRLFTLKLVSVPAMGAPVRMRARKSDCEDEWAIVETLASADWRLLVISDKEGEPCVEVAHEVLLTEWKTLVKWIDIERDFLIWKADFKGDFDRHKDLLSTVEANESEIAAEALSNSHSQASASELFEESYLQGLDLRNAKMWLEERQESIERDEKKFIEDSDRRYRMQINSYAEKARRVRLEKERNENLELTLKQLGHIDDDEAQFNVPSKERLHDIENYSEGPLTGGKFINFSELKRIVDRTASVANIMTPEYAPYGTGFLVEGSDINPEYGEQLLLLTNAHVIWDDSWDSKITLPQRRTAPNALDPKEAIIIFQSDAEGGQANVYRCNNTALWQSPSHLHDVCLIPLKESVAHLKPLPIAPMNFTPQPEDITAGNVGTSLAVLAHTGAEPFSLSIMDAIESTNGVLVDMGPREEGGQDPIYLHYRIPTIAGLSGAPVFETENWTLIGIHHGGLNEDQGRPKLNGKPGTIFAHEGIDIQSIRRAIQKDLGGTYPGESKWWPFGK